MHRGLNLWEDPGGSVGLGGLLALGQAGFVKAPDAWTSEEEERLPLPFQSVAHMNQVFGRKGISRTNSP